MKKLRVGFVGLGAMGLSHARAIQRLCAGEAEVVALCGSREEHLRTLQSEFASARLFSTVDDMMEAVDAVFVSTPNYTHTELAEKIVGAGKHLFLEKPCGITRDDCKRLTGIAENSNQIVMVGHEFRYSPYFKKIKDLVEGGEIGRTRMVWTREFRGPFQKKSADWIHDNRRSGGCLVDKNCHHFDLMNWWVGDTPTKVAAFGGRSRVNPDLNVPPEHQVNDHAVVAFDYAGGAKGSLQLSMFALDFPNEELEMGIVGEGGVIATRIARLEILQWKKGTGEKEPKVHTIAAKHGEGWGNHLGFDEIHLEFMRCILEGRQPLTSPKNCVNGTLLAICAEESIATGKAADML